MVSWYPSARATESVSSVSGGPIGTQILLPQTPPLSTLRRVQINDICSGFNQRIYPSISLRKIAIWEQTQGRKRKVHSHTAPRAGCPRCCRLWVVVWPRRAKVGYGYLPAYLGACWGAFRCAESEAGERGGVVDTPAPVTSAHSAGSFTGSATGVVKWLFRWAVGTETEKAS